MSYEPTHLKRWFDQINYEGEDFSGYYVASMRFFKCTPTERANYAYVWEHLEDSGADRQQLLDVMFTDESYLCRHYILVREDATRALRMADMFAERVIRKGSLDPEQEALIDQQTVMRRWAKSAIRHRVVHCREAGVSIFAARRGRFPFEAKNSNRLFDYYSEV